MIAKSQAISDETVESVCEMIGYGITYWAISADWDNAPKGKARDKVVCAFREAESEKDFFLTATDIRKAIRALHNGTAQDFDGSVFRGYARNYVDFAYRDADENGIDGGHLDSDAADVIAQVAALGKVIYG